jgi:hypothetical protein
MVTAAVDDSIRSEIGKPKRKRRSSDRREKDCRAADLGRRMSCAAPDGDHGDRHPRRLHSAEAGAAARSRFGAALIPCKTIEKRRLAKYDGCVIESWGRVYIGLQGVDLE